MNTLPQFVRVGPVVAIVMLLTACATSAPPAEAPVSVEPPPRSVATPPARVPEASPPQQRSAPPADAALQPLLEKAAQATERGDYDQALVLLERAQRIDPGSADVYLGMAQTHGARGDAQQARATAERGLLYCLTGAQCNALRAYMP